MPREIDLNPCEKQKTLMESLGFQHAESAWNYPLVPWYGHGVTLNLWKEHDEPTLADVLNAIVQQAREDGRQDAQKAAREAFKIAFGFKL